MEEVVYFLNELIRVLEVSIIEIWRFVYSFNGKWFWYTLQAFLKKLSQTIRFLSISGP